MKKITLLGVIITSLMIIFPLNASALSVSKNELTIANGNSKNLELTTNVEEEITQISFNLIFLTYDVVASLNPAANLTNVMTSGSNYTINFNEPQKGLINLGSIKIDVKKNPTGTSGGISLYGATATTTSGAKLSLTPQMINVIIGDEPEEEPSVNEIEEPPTTNNAEENIEENNQKKEEEKNTETPPPTEESKTPNFLKQIDSKLAKIKLKENQFEYEIVINKSIKELDLKPIAIDDTYQIEISSQKIEELKDNQIIITVRSTDAEQIYKINVKQMTIDEEKSEVDYGYKKTWWFIICGLIIVLIIGIVLLKRK